MDKEVRWPSFVVTLFLFLEIVSFFFVEKTVFYVLFLLIGLVIVLKEYNYVVQRQTGLLLLFLIFALYCWIAQYFFQNRLTTYPLRILMHFGVLILCLKYTIRSGFIYALMLAYMVVVLYLRFGLVVDIDDILPTASQNFVGWVALALGFFYYTLVYIQNKKIRILPALLVFGMALISLGRSTIGGALVLLFIVLYQRFYIGSIRFKIVFFCLIGLVIVSLLLPFGFGEQLYEGFEKFQIKGLSLDRRDIILLAYADRISLTTFFMGVTPLQYPFSDFNGNFHNSYLLAHSNFGIMGLFFVMYLIYLLIKTSSRNIFLFGILLAFMLRIFTDTIAFVGEFDFVFFYIVILSREVVNQKSRKFKFK